MSALSGRKRQKILDIRVFSGSFPIEHGGNPRAGERSGKSVPRGSRMPAVGGTVWRRVCASPVVSTRAALIAPTLLFPASPASRVSTFPQAIDRDVSGCGLTAPTQGRLLVERTRLRNAGHGHKGRVSSSVNEVSVDARPATRRPAGRWKRCFVKQPSWIPGHPGLHEVSGSGPRAGETSARPARVRCEARPGRPKAVPAMQGVAS